MALSGLCTFVRSERMQTVRTLTARMKISENIFKISENPNVSVKNRRYHQGKVLWNTNYMVKWAFSNILFFSSKYDIILSFSFFSCVKLLLNATIVHQDGQTPCQQRAKTNDLAPFDRLTAATLVGGKIIRCVTFDSQTATILSEFSALESEARCHLSVCSLFSSYWIGVQFDGLGGVLLNILECNCGRVWLSWYVYGIFYVRFRSRWSHL